MTKKLFVSRHRLTECPGCLNHIRLDDNWRTTQCPFCGAAFASALQQPKRDLFATLQKVQSTTGGLVAASLLGLGLVACEADTGLLDPNLADTGAQRSDDAGHFQDAQVIAEADASLVDAADPVPGPEYGEPGIPDTGVVDAGFVDAGEPPPVADYGLPPVFDASVADAEMTDTGEPPIVLLYGNPPVDAGGS
jgi:hypothetical protein